MEQTTTRHELTRRAVIAGTAASAGGLLLTSPVSAQSLVPTYALDPTIGGTCVAPGCSVCNACIAHGANKLFATLADAEAGRAHPGCQCTAVTGISVTQSVFDQLFTAGPSADRRWATVGALLAATPGTVVAPAIRGLVPVAATIGGVAAIGWIAARRRTLSTPTNG
jgi:hypothetical protein